MTVETAEVTGQLKEREIVARNIDGVTCLMSPCARVLASAAQEAAGDQDEVQHCPQHQVDVPLSQVGVGDGLGLLYRGGGGHWTISAR